MNLQLKGRKQQEEIQKQNGKSVNEKINHYANLGTALIKADLVIEQHLDYCQLRELEEHGIVERKIYPEVPPRVEYSIMEKGQRLEGIFIELKRFGLTL
ncbi:winged helix-turn-helix transcriptional regulator [Paenibacillus apiarius]|uniref:winged helix-turn-helix transcriptional regulator n=1 Tax=Paenibacillus apiarius TaxID=46240 RepID=UPI001F08FF8F|nr:winged helix-turn-helix transcriptional regulator [Paenibacillus apiarius]